MRRTLTSAIVGGAAASGGGPTGKTMINDNNLIEWYNSVNGATWVAGHNDFFNGMTFDDARPILGTALSHVSEHLNSTLSDSVYAALGNAPAEFDARTKWSGLIHPIRNQLRCGSCWAFSASEVMSDRVAIANGKASPVLSAEDLVSCDKNDFGCRGGFLDKAWSYIKNDGLATDTCYPYTAGGGYVAACRTTCVDSEAFTRTRAVSAYAINGLTNMQKEMSTNGPIQVAFEVYRSFMSYKSGVYHKQSWEVTPEGGHAVKMIGWGSESGTDYWLVANSWGTTQWGEGGFFKIKRGVNECGIETRGPPYAGMPAKAKPAYVMRSLVDEEGSELKALDDVTPSDCEHECDATTACHSFSFSASKKRCHLKDKCVTVDQASDHNPGHHGYVTYYKPCSSAKNVLV